MFSWSKKKESKKRGRPERSSEENEFGIKMDKGPDDKQLEAELKALAGVDELPEDEINLNEGEDDVESELLRLIGGSNGKKPAKKPTSAVETLGNINADITDDIDVGDEDVEVDENDPELLGELLELTQPEEVVEEEPESDPEPEPTPSAGESDIMTILKERLQMYKSAEAKAKASNENSRARRFSRGIKTLEGLLKKAKAGNAVSPSDIPPVIALNLKPAPPVQPETHQSEGDTNGIENEVTPEGESEDTSNQQDTTNEQSTEAEAEDIVTTLTKRLQMYQVAEEKAKESGETTRARRFNRGIKAIQGLLSQAKAGKPVSPLDIPPAVALNLKPAPPVQPAAPAEENLEAEGIEDEMRNINLEQSSSDDTTGSRQDETTEKNIMDVLSERLQLYRAAEAKAKETGEGTRARRFGRGIKTIQDLIRQATAGKPIAPDDIPPPIAVNLKPAPPVVVRRDEDEEPRDSAVESENLVRSSDVPAPIKFAPAEDDDVDLDAELEEEEIPRTVLEGLEQRLRIYRSLQERAEADGDEDSAHKNERFVRVYLNAIRAYKNGEYLDIQGLPTPKGCPPIPIPFQIE